MPLYGRIEKKWLKKFKKSILVDPWTGSFRSNYAKQLFSGKDGTGYPDDFPADFEAVYQNRASLTQSEIIEKCQLFLECVGILIPLEKLLTHLATYTDDHHKVFSKTYYIIRRISQYADTLDTSKIFEDNTGDILFFSRIASGESLISGQLNLFEDLEIPKLHQQLTMLPEGYETQEEVKKLFDAIENSNDCFFITGKAGTGKSTFIHYLTQKSRKQNILLTAFTGIAAINVHGQTIHSIFQFPFRPLLPGDDEIKVFGQNTPKHQIIANSEMIIIDEVSMVRADLLEAIDYSLRRNGGDTDKVFGGKQIIFVGDIFQLPPVVSNDDETDRHIFNQIFQSEYFFASSAFNTCTLRYHEFQKSHRQSLDRPFLTLLDRIRICDVDFSVIDAINTRHFPEYSISQEEFVVMLTTTNKNAALENSYQLSKLNYIEYNFHATILGEFDNKRYPTDKMLRLKRGAQVMFVKNDISRRWVNGTIGKVHFITEDAIEVRLANGEIYKVTPERWENRKYKYDARTKKIKTEVKGTFEQFPLKLAWAMTIHKSQGLTFDKVIVDFGHGAFVNGQVYTALSRCRTLDGIFLRTKLRVEDIISDPRLVEFYKGFAHQHEEQTEQHT